MFKRTWQKINSAASKKPRLLSSESSEKENLSIEEDSGLGPEIDDEGNSDKMATSFGSQNLHFAFDNTNINSKTPDFDERSQSSETFALRRTRSRSLQDANTMQKLVAHQPNAFSDKSPRKISLRPRKIRQASSRQSSNTLLLYKDAVDEGIAMSQPNDEHLSMEVDGEDDVFSQFSATQPSNDHININGVLETLESPIKNGDPSKITPVIIQSEHLENGNKIMLTGSSVSLNQANSAATDEEIEEEKEEEEVVEPTLDSLSQNSANVGTDLINGDSSVNQEDEESPLQSHSHSDEYEYVPSSSSSHETPSKMPEVKKKRRKNGTRFTHVKTHKTPVKSNLVVDDYKPKLSNNRELIVNNITMPKDFTSRLHTKITKIGLMKKIIINYYGRDRMHKIALKEPTRKHPGVIHPTLLVNDSQVQDIIDLYNYYAPLVSLNGPPLPFKKVRQIIGNLCSQIRIFY